MTVKIKSPRSRFLELGLAYISVVLIIAYVVLAYRRLPAITNLGLTIPLVVILTFLIDGFKSVIESLSVLRRKPSTKPFSALTNSQLTVVIACHNGESTVGRTVKSVRQSLPGALIIVVDDASNDETSHHALTGGAKVLKLGYNRGKVGAIHRVLKLIRTEFVMIMDDDMIIGQIELPYYLLDKYDAVAFNVVPTGKGKWVKLQRFEYRKSMQIGKNFHAPSGSVLCVSGAIGLFRTSRLQDQIELHSGEFSGEDLERTLLIHSTIPDARTKGVTYVNQVIYTEVPTKLGALFRQRCLGWGPGFMANAWLLCRLLVRRNSNWRLRVEAFYNLANLLLDILRIAALPILFRYPLIFMIMYLCYLLLDSLAWITTNRYEAYWIVVVMPIYGIFNLLTRFIGIIIWLYREVIELMYLKMRHNPDSYKVAPYSLQTISFLMILGLEGYFLYWLSKVIN